MSGSWQSTCHFRLYEREWQTPMKTGGSARARHATLV